MQGARYFVKAYTLTLIILRGKVGNKRIGTTIAMLCLENGKINIYNAEMIKKASIAEFDAINKDKYIICSDGITDMTEEGRVYMKTLRFRKYLITSIIQVLLIAVYVVCNIFAFKSENVVLEPLKYMLPLAALIIAIDIVSLIIIFRSKETKSEEVIYDEKN